MLLDFRMGHSGQDDLRRVARQLRAHGDAKVIRREMTKALREGTKPAVVNVKAASLALPAKSGKSTGLRRRMAAATSAQVRTAGRNPGVKVRVRRARMGDQASLPKVTNEGVWRHPVFGDRETWVTQTSRRGWFDTANRRSAPGVRREIKKILDDTERKLTHH